MFLYQTEKKAILTKKLVTDIKNHAMTINEAVYKKIKTGLMRNVCIVTDQDNWISNYVANDTRKKADLCLMGYNHDRSVFQVNFEDVPKLNSKKIYIFTDPSAFLTYKMFHKYGLKCQVYTGFLSSYLEMIETDEMFMIVENCMRLLENTRNAKLIFENFSAWIHEGRPSEIRVIHKQMPAVIKTVFKGRCMFLEDLKKHFIQFMKTALPGMSASSFCDSYTNSVIKFLYKTGVLCTLPDIEEYPELVCCLFPFKVSTYVLRIREDEIITGGIVLDGIIENEYVRSLFSAEKVKSKIKNGGRFIFTAHVSFNYKRKKYLVRFF